MLTDCIAELELLALGLQPELEACEVSGTTFFSSLESKHSQNAHHQGAEEVTFRKRFPSLPRDSSFDQACRRCQRSIPSGECRRVPTCRCIAIHFCPHRRFDWYVPVQVQADATSSDVQGLETSNLLPLQYWPGRQGPRMRLLGTRLARLAVLPPWHRSVT